jgi:hypothetical protein
MAGDRSFGRLGGVLAVDLSASGDGWVADDVRQEDTVPLVSTTTCSVSSGGGCA